eukprot:CFRG8238T1
MGLQGVYPSYYVGDNNPSIAEPQDTDFTGAALMTSDQYRHYEAKHSEQLPTQHARERRGAKTTKRYVGNQEF